MWSNHKDLSESNAVFLTWWSCACMVPRALRRAFPKLADATSTPMSSWLSLYCTTLLHWTRMHSSRLRALNTLYRTSLHEVKVPSARKPKLILAWMQHVFEDGHIKSGVDIPAQRHAAPYEYIQIRSVLRQHTTWSDLMKKTHPTMPIHLVQYTNDTHYHYITTFFSLPSQEKASWQLVHIRKYKQYCR